MNDHVTMKDAYASELKALRAQLDAKDTRIFELEEEIALLRGGTELTIALFPKRWHLTGQERSVLGALLRAPEGNVCRHEAILNEHFGDRDHDRAKHLCAVVITRLRKKMQPDGITIENVWGDGYWVTPAHRRKIEALIEQEKQAA